MSLTGKAVKKTAGALFLLLSLLAGVAFGAHPLITDDAGTQGKGKCQFELNGHFEHDEEGGVEADNIAAAAYLSHGITDSIDIVAGIPYATNKVEHGGTEHTDSGLSDVSVELKWRFYEKNGCAIALKPGLTFPSGDDKKGLGAGRTTYGAMLVASKELSPAALHLNLGYKRNENTSGQREDLWHASLAGTYEAVSSLTLVGNIGIDRNPYSGSNPAFAIAGLIYSVAENFDIDLGYKAGLNDAAADYALLAGVVLRF